MTATPDRFWYLDELVCARAEQSHARVEGARELVKSSRRLVVDTRARIEVTRAMCAPTDLPPGKRAQTPPDH